MNKTDLGLTLLQAQVLARSENPLDHIIAREMIAKLIEHNIEEDENSQGPKKSLTTTTKYRRKSIYKFVNILYNIQDNYIS